jgi:hypothetical protein
MAEIQNDTNIKLEIEKYVETILVELGVSADLIDNREIRLETVIYHVYWYNRLANNAGEQERIFISLVRYLDIGDITIASSNLIDTLLKNEVLSNNAKHYCLQYLLPLKTVDLVVTKAGLHSSNAEVLVIARDFYPLGYSLPGGFVIDSDSDNPYNIPADLYAALRIANTKIFGQSTEPNITITKNSQGREVHTLTNANSVTKLIIEPLDERGYIYKENIKTELRPSDPRHIVDTIAYRCELIGEELTNDKLTWALKADLMDVNKKNNGFAFEHHREIISHITAQSSLLLELQYDEHNFIRNIINNPLDTYKSYQERFAQNNNNHNTSFPELFTAVKTLLEEMYTDEVNVMCSKDTTLAGIRDKATIALRHVSLKNRVFCPYLPTLHAIFDAIQFFDIYSRQQKEFYNSITKENIHEHNPRTLKYSSYHMYRYKYRFDDLLSLVPEEIIIPTFEPLSMNDLMAIRCVPIRFIGLSTKFLYVDEFEQTPEEFMMHDINHSWRMMSEDKATCKDLGLTKEALMEKSSVFTKEYLAKLLIKKSDVTEHKEMKNLKKVIAFEIVHEDARPFMPEIICKYIQQKEGNLVPFEVPRIDPVTNYMDVVDTLDTGISTLSYVRNKLQHGFYDDVSNQRQNLVGTEYRTATHITEAALVMLDELGAKISQEADTNADGKVDYEWLLKRTCAVGPDNIHESSYIDPAVAKYGGDAEKLNPKRYQV